MEHLSFDNMQAVYGLNTEFRKQKNEDYISHYSCQWLIDAHYDHPSETYEFCLDRKDVQINRKKIEKLMDKVVYEIGTSLYPMRLKVSKQMEIQEILNYTEITERRKETTEKSRSDHPGEVIDRYIRYAEKNISDPKAFLRALYRDSFINMYFRNLYNLPENKNERERVEWYNFPLREMNSIYFCKIDQFRENNRKLNGELMSILPGQEGMASVDYTYGPKGSIKEVEGLFTAVNNQHEYQKKIHISPIKIEFEKSEKK